MKIYKSKKITINRLSKGEVILIFWLFLPFILAVARFILNAFGIAEGVGRELLLLFLSSIPFLTFVVFRNKFPKENYIPFCYLLYIVIISVIFTMLFNPDSVEYLVRNNYGLERLIRPDCAMFAFLFFMLVDKVDDYFFAITLYAYIDVLFLFLVELIPAMNRGYWTDIGPYGDEIILPYSLSFGYSMLFPTITFIYKAIKERDIINAILSIVCIWAIVTQGNRGALFMILIFVFLFLTSRIKNTKNSILKLSCVSALLLSTIVLFYFNDLIIEYVIERLTSAGITSRSLDMLSRGTFTNDNGRIIIWETVIGAISDNLITGYGVFGDRPFVSPLHYVGYSHNIFLEFLVSFGVIGLILVYYTIVYSVKMIYVCNNEKIRELYIILFSVSCQLLLSMSFWYVFEFWACAALIYKSKKLGFI